MSYDCTAFDNYSPRRIYINGLKTNPYFLTYSGVRFANGQKYLGSLDGQAAAGPIPQAAVINVPDCRCCH